MRRFSFLLLVIFLIILSLFISNSNFFAVKTVDVKMYEQSSSKNKITCTDSENIKNSSNLLGKNLIFIDYTKVVNNIKNQYVCIRDIMFSKNFPDKINLSVLGREAIGKLVKVKAEATQSASIENIATPSAQTPESFLVDKEGVIFSKDLEQINIPSLFIKDLNISLGMKLDESIGNGLKILEKVKKINLNFESTEVLDKFLIIFPTSDNPKVIFKLDKDINTQLASLQLILNKAKIDNRSLEFIDLRFDKPIVRFAPKNN